MSARPQKRPASQRSSGHRSSDQASNRGLPSTCHTKWPSDGHEAPKIGVKPQVLVPSHSSSRVSVAKPMQPASSGRFCPSA